MGIRSTLTKGKRRTGENNTPQLKCPSSLSSKSSFCFTAGSNQGDSDSEATSFSSSVHESTSSRTSSTDRYSSAIKGGKHQSKTLDTSNSQKVTGYGSITPAAAFRIEPSDASPDLQKSRQKFTRSGSLKSLKILRKKNTSSSESKKPSTVNDLHSKKATFSSILKDSKFPEQVELEPQVGVKESEEVLSAAKLCSYEHCSLHGNHYHHETPLKRFSYLRHRSSKDRKSISPQVRATDKHPAKKKEAKVAKKVSNEYGKEKEVDFSIEFYAKTRPEPSSEPNCSRDDVHLADIMFGVNGDDQNDVRNLQMDDQDRLTDVKSKKLGFNDEIQMSMWRLIHRHMESGLIEQQLQEEKQSCLDDDDVMNQGKETQKMFAVKIVREAVEKILLPEEDGSEKNQGNDDQTDPNKTANDLFGTKKDKPNEWNHVKKVILMRRFITELEKAKKTLDPDKRRHVPLVPEPEPEPEPEAETVSLRSQTSVEKKNSNEWMLDYALQQVVAELAPTQKRKVALLVKSFEMITPKLAKEVAI
ncbi:putative calcium/calmodulin-dependent protein kinase [Helianthus annuus]|nr:putative calcium/calmodulin-dependent protein kinase [Helianthus annuus]